MANDLEQSVKRLDFAVEKSMRYHQRRRGHYDLMHKWLLFGTILSGSAAFGGRILEPGYFGAAAAVFAAFDLVWSLSHRARDHEMLFRRFSDLAIAIRSTSQPTQDHLTDWIKARITIESDEPPMYCALEADCDNEVRRARGQSKEFAHIGLFHRATMNWIRHAQVAFSPKPNPKEPRSSASS
ncbi:MAG: hypothetical protein F4145_00565 [Boseongicola sp. SB0675_bin_26]|nr:hypothetical protein [Boseongicola sp. SB0675_bin_26]